MLNQKSSFRIILLIAIWLVYPSTVEPKNKPPRSESEILSSIETIIDSRDTSKAAYLRELATKNKFPSVRSRAIGAIMLLGDRSAISLLPDILMQDSSVHVRQAAAYAMCEFRSHMLINPLLKALEHDSDPIVRAISARALGLQGSEEAARVLLSYILRDPSYQVRIESAVAIAKLQMKGAVEPLKLVITKDPEKLVRIAAIQALSSSKDSGALRFLMEEFESATDPDVRFELYKGIVSLQGPSTYLEMGLKDSDERIRFLALKKLTESIDYQKRGLSSSKQVLLITDMLSDPFKGIRELANDTLNRLGYKTKDLGVRYEVVR